MWCFRIEKVNQQLKIQREPAILVALQSLWFSTGDLGLRTEGICFTPHGLLVTGFHVPVTPVLCPSCKHWTPLLPPQEGDLSSWCPQPCFCPDPDSGCTCLCSLRLAPFTLPCMLLPPPAPLSPSSCCTTRLSAEGRHLLQGVGSLQGSLVPPLLWHFLFYRYSIMQRCKKTCVGF